MYKPQRDNRFGGKKKFGGKRDDRGYGDKPSFKAICAECGDSCTVPFRPNGKKPVLCSNCFGGATKSYDKKPYEKKGPYKPSMASSNGDMEGQLKAIHHKLDRIMEMLDASRLD